MPALTPPFCSGPACLSEEPGAGEAEAGDCPGQRAAAMGSSFSSEVESGGPITIRPGGR